jgi:hypothetical protein
MAIQLALLPDAHLLLLAAYEDGRLVAYTASASKSAWDEQHKEEGQGWELAWWEKGHREPSPLCSPSFMFLTDHRSFRGLT